MANVVITGGTGYIGSTLCSKLKAEGHKITVLTRGKSQERDGVLYLNYAPEKKLNDHPNLHRTDTVFHLAGLNINTGFRWSASVKKELLESRTVPLEMLHAYFKEHQLKPHVISAGGITHYGDHYTGISTEDSDTEKAENLLAQVCRAWEKAAFGLEKIGCPVSVVRTAVVLEPGNAVWKRLKPVANIPFLALPFSGKQAFAWISKEDLVAIYLLIFNQKLTGIFNAASPAQDTLKEVLEKIKGSKKSILPLPSFILRFIFGAKSVLFLSGTFVIPKRLQEKDFVFKHREISDFNLH